MGLDFHRQAETLLAQAEHEGRLGNSVAERALYSQAADAELAALRQVDATKDRTRAVIAISAVALFDRAERFAEGVTLAHRVLGEPELQPAAAQELEALLDDLRSKQAAATLGLTTLTDQFEWVLRGRSIGAGVAPLELVGRKIAQIEKLGVRVYEYLAAVPLRRQGPPDPAVESGLRIMIGQPAAGSFRFGLRFAASEKQIALPGFEDTPPPASIAPKALGDAFVKIVQAAARPDEEERFESVVPVPDYRDAFFKLVRNLVPDGQDVREIELKRAEDGRTVSRLIPATGKAITRHLQAKRAPRPEDEPSITDVLRGLQLNEGWIALGMEPERRIHLAPDLAIEDVIGPLVNHPVTVAVHREHGRLFADDIEPAG